MPPLLPVVEIREGGEVRAGVVLETSGDKQRLILAGGREMRLARARIVHETGEQFEEAPPARLASRLAEWEAGADRRAAGIDLAALHELLSADDASAGSLSLADVATLALGDASPQARAAVHRAMARPNPWFRFTGSTWQARTSEEVDAELDKQRRARELLQAREAFVLAARRRLAGDEVALPEGSAKFLRGLRDVAVHGDGASTRREAAQVLAEIEGRPEGDVPSPEHSFDVLVRLGALRRDENLALLRAGVVAEFPPEVEAAAAEAAGRGPGEGRLDLRHVELVTVDDATTTEVDDGVSLETTPRGLRLGIHISDAAHFVDRGSILDDEALARATSYYLPEGSIKMLPRTISEGAASLAEGQDRPALSFLVDVTPHGEILEFAIRETVVRVTRRMTYEDCEAALAGGQGMLPRIAELAAVFEAERLAAGASPIRAHEIDVAFDDRGEPLIRLVDPGRPARQLVAELMVLGNRLVAQWCRDRGIPAIYRKQPPPTGAAPAPPRDRVDPVAAFDFRKTLQRTEVSLEAGPHAGLGVPCYLQATSPIRRYQDLAMHRMVKAALRGEPLPYSRQELLAVAASTEQAGRLARSVETETDQYWILRALESRVGDTLAGVLLRRDDRHSLVELVDYAHVTPIAPRPDHVKGQRVLLRVRGVRPRRKALTLEEIASP